MIYVKNKINRLESLFILWYYLEIIVKDMVAGGLVVGASGKGDGTYELFIKKVGD